MRHNPSKFNGKVNPNEANQLVRDIEKNFKATQCPEERKLSYAIYMLIEEAEFWGIGMKQMMEDREQIVTQKNEERLVCCKSSVGFTNQERHGKGCMYRKEVVLPLRKRNLRESFRVRLLEEYFPNSVRCTKEIEFM